MWNRLLISAWMMFALFSARPLAAHSYHVSMAEVGLSEKGDRLEISVRIFADDLEAALTQQSGQRVSLAATKDVDRRIEQYLNARFRAATASGKPLSLKLVGKKPDGDTLWLFAESAERPGRAVQLANTLLFELFADQLNVVKMLVSPVRSVTFTPRDTTSRLLQF